MRSLLVGISLFAVGWIASDAAHATTETTVEVGMGICRHAGAVTTEKGCSYCSKYQCTWVACDKNGCSVVVMPSKAPPPGGGAKPGTAVPIQSGPEKPPSR